MPLLSNHSTISPIANLSKLEEEEAPDAIQVTIDQHRGDEEWLEEHETHAQEDVDHDHDHDQHEGDLPKRPSLDSHGKLRGKSDSNSDKGGKGDTKKPDGGKKK
ncbi:hypothetical protein FRC18_003084 [Serendipita sp. 400]|nr:hypothetical protein FRC18_003084 [Serendipita sp. 400]